MVVIPLAERFSVCIGDSFSNRSLGNTLNLLWCRFTVEALMPRWSSPSSNLSIRLLEKSTVPITKSDLALKIFGTSVSRLFEQLKFSTSFHPKKYFNPLSSSTLGISAILLLSRYTFISLTSLPKGCNVSISLLVQSSNDNFFIFFKRSYSGNSFNLLYPKYNNWILSAHFESSPIISSQFSFNTSLSSA